MLRRNSPGFVSFRLKHNAVVPTTAIHPFQRSSRPLIGRSQGSIVKMSLNHSNKAFTALIFPSIDTMALPRIVHLCHSRTDTYADGNC